MNANLRSFHSSFEEKKLRHLEEEEIIELWFIFKDLEKKLSKIFRRIVSVQDYSMSLNIKDKIIRLHGSEVEFKRGLCKLEYAGKNYSLPEDKDKFISNLDNLPDRSNNVDIPQKKKIKVFGEEVEI